MQTSEFLAAQGLRALTPESESKIVLADRSGKLEEGKTYVLDILDEKGHILAGEKPFGDGVVRYFAAHCDGKEVVIVASQLWRLAYTNNTADAKCEAVCQAAKEMRNAIKGLTVAEIVALPELVGKTITVTGTVDRFVKERIQEPFGPDNCQPRKYPVFEIK